MESILYQIIGQRIREFREKRGVTQGYLSERINLTRTSVANMEAGRQKVRLESLYQISDVLRISPHDLLPTLDEIRHQQVNLPLGLDTKSYTSAELDWVMKVIQKGKKSEGECNESDKKG